MILEFEDNMPIGRVQTEWKDRLTTTVGIARDPETDEIVYELCVEATTQAPLIVDKKTGRYWYCTWRRMIALAEREGLAALGERGHTKDVEHCCPPTGAAEQ